MVRTKNLLVFYETKITPDGHYLNLPVMNEPGEIVGMVDVLKLTYATLEQVRSIRYLSVNLFTYSNIDQYDVYLR